MFCPICGCTVNDNTKLCLECGHRFFGREKEDLKVDTTVVKESSYDTVMSRTRTKGHRIGWIISLASAVLLIVAYFLPWAEGVKYDMFGNAVQTTIFSAVDILENGGDAWGIFAYAPLIAVVFGCIGLVCSAMGNRGKMGTISFISGITATAVLVVFALIHNSTLIVLDGYYVTELGSGIYIGIVGGVLLCASALQCMKSDARFRW